MGDDDGGLRAGEGRAAARRRAQLARRRGEGRPGGRTGADDAPPYAWAAFVPVGDEGPRRRPAAGASAGGEGGGARAKER
ncbi:MAG TPA: hypothetical protein VFS43_34280 [Polyangiaceae bacterium]|nr:hypothetical protein [Polyangiaceae bacterium]